MEKALFFAATAIILLLCITQVDDNLSEESIELIKRLDLDGESESYLYLFGIFAKEGDNPAQVGESLIAEYRKLGEDESYEVKEYPSNQKLALPNDEAFCDLWEDNCIEHLFSPNLDIENLIIENQLLISRVDRFLEFREYQTLLKPTASEPFPPYQYINSAARIKILRAITFYRNGDTLKSIGLLTEQYEKLRKSMELQDNIVGKLIFLMKLSEVLDIMSVILSNNDIDTKLIPSLSPSEKSFYMIVAREFGLSYYTFKDLDKHPEIFEVEGNTPGWFTRLVYKPNMTINAVSPIYLRAERLTQLSPSEFAKQLETREENSRIETSKLRNYVGNTLANMTIDFDDYIARFFDFDAKLALFNQLHHLKLDMNNMQNPYYSKEVPTNNNGGLCFSGPLEDHKYLRCLRVKLSSENPIPNF